MGTTERISGSTTGEAGNWNSEGPSISADGRFVAFESGAGNLVSGDTNGHPEVFVVERAGA
jgi:Tol biopolymer transport system component